MTTLIFPAGMPDAISFLHNCNEQHKTVIGASSLLNDPSREQYDKWAFLPYVTDPQFPASLANLLTEQAVTELFTPNPTVWNVLNQLLPTIAPTVALLGDSPVAKVLASYRSSKMVADRLWGHRDFLHANGEARMRMSQTHFDALVHHANTIPGMCDHQKLLALAEIFRDSPQGDVVEIGSWWGKSAFILHYLARQYAIGGVLCVDPWSNEHALQDVKILNDMADEMSVSEGHQVFLMNLIPYNSGHFNFLRLPSVDAACVYRANASITSDAFGQTDYGGKISVLHIDGNHKKSAVEADIQAWGALVMGGGWIIFDDYKWPFGNGPKLVADEFLTLHRETICQAFYMGGALFLKMDI